MESYVDSIAYARGETEVLRLVNAFLASLWRSGAISRAPSLLRVRHMKGSGDVVCWLGVMAASIELLPIEHSGAPGLVYAMHAVFEAAFHRLRALDALSPSGANLKTPAGTHLRSY